MMSEPRRSRRFYPNTITKTIVPLLLAVLLILLLAVLIIVALSLFG
jgi:hypothetical protein